ncbi:MULTISPECIES: hypothetical protein [unclassified Streptomyces]|uniref:hypothetical protein n=1 Tax=unclassified Streptomyces TaxID=2593676 RepID=UPI002254D982|nr:MULTISPECIES: hypothetical protein [unclassified Streptomyces]MCX4527088.1 hypothetical protein [Streptomyces sp. NBC_01551]MCX4542336.1 hypothetical protein [Streptomyces sp. NBC_01565]
MAMTGAFKLVTGLSLAVVGCVGAGVLWLVTGDSGEDGGPAGTADCTEAMAFARMDPPPGLRDGTCDRSEAADGRATVLGTFRMEHADVEAWVASFPKAPRQVACPGPHPENYDPENEGCFTLAHDEPQPGRAAGLRLRITPEVGTTAKVRFEAS